MPNWPPSSPRRMRSVAPGEAWQWRATPKGRLAEIIVLDQFTRQLHRGSPQAFAQDKMAWCWRRK